MIHLFWKSLRPPTPQEQASQHRIRPAFVVLDPSRDSIHPSLQSFLRAEACSAGEAQALAVHLGTIGLAAAGTVEFQGDECGKELGEEPTFQAAGSVTVTTATDLFPRQTYLQGRGSGGVDALAAWRLDGGRGDRVRIVDIEPGGLPDHPDLARVKRFHEPLTLPGPDLHLGHTAEVLGVIGGINDRRGVVGLASDADVSLAQTRLADERFHPLNVLRFVVSTVAPPAVVVMPMTTILPRLDLPIQGGVILELLPLEMWSIGRAVLEVARQRGVYVVLPAGNDGFLLDERMNFAPAAQPRTGSDAILVGAAEPGSDAPLDVSGKGIRVNLSSWGGGVTTSTIDRDSGYAGHRHDFAGTSAATAIVAGCVACIAGVLQANGYAPLSAAEMRRRLVRTGYWSSAGLGPRPDIGAVLEELKGEGMEFRLASVA